MKPALRSLVFAAVFLTGCAMGPNYKRPDVPAPPQFRGAEASQKSIADTKWHDLFQDPVLKDLIDTALKQNYDIRIAAERVMQARAQYGITRADLFPALGVSTQFVANRAARIGAIPFAPPGANLDAGYTQAGFTLSWELDIWGRIRRLKEAGAAEYMASEEARRAVTTSLVADVTSGYFTLRALDLELDIARKTKEVAERGLKLTQLRRDRGVVTGLDVSQAEQFLYTANAQIEASERSMTQAENALQFLLGQNPGATPRGKALEEFVAPSAVPPGLPSDLLERRPDIRQAEQRLIAANARIGAARAMYFPRISLTGLMAGQSRYLEQLFTGPARQWNFTPAATVPIFDAGRIRSEVKLSEASKRELVVQYEKTIQTAFREVADSLTGYSHTRKQREQQELLVAALRKSTTLSSLRYEGGLESYLQVLDAQRNLFQGELNLAQLRLQELNTVVQLYRALGGGWQ
ncbi:MAG: efflux transporter outer membrane subunit [Bryobacteraceae bacterium]